MSIATVREPKLAPYLSPKEKSCQVLIVAELRTAGIPRTEQQVARDTGLYHPTKLGMKDFKRLVDDLVAKREIKFVGNGLIELA